METRHFFHSFPRPRAGEDRQDTIKRGLKILSLMKDVGLVQAPEVVSWDVSAMTAGKETLQILQRRACFTELALSELDKHSQTFGPFALSFNIEELRIAGAMPVVYVPQGSVESPLSLLGQFAVRGAWHTHYVLRQLQDLKEASDPVSAQQRFGRPLLPDATITLRNPDASGSTVAEDVVPASHVDAVMKYVGFNNIPFDQSVGVLSIFLNMFYPTDNTHVGEILGYYRQREWRLIAGDLLFNNRAMGRSLTQQEVQSLNDIDSQFWTRDLIVDGRKQSRSSLALAYDPVNNWNLFDLVEAVHVPQAIVDDVKQVVGDAADVRPRAYRSGATVAVPHSISHFIG
jgi:hypothetical protein